MKFPFSGCTLVFPLYSLRALKLKKKTTLHSFMKKGCSDKQRQLQVLQCNQCLTGSLLVWSRYWRGLTFITAWSKEQSYSQSKERADCLILTSYNSLRTWKTSFQRAAAALANSKGPDLSISEKPGKAGRYHLFWEANWNGSWSEVCCKARMWGEHGLLSVWALEHRHCFTHWVNVQFTHQYLSWWHQRSQAATK